MDPFATPEVVFWRRRLLSLKRPSRSVGRARFRFGSEIEPSFDSGIEPIVDPEIEPVTQSSLSTPQEEGSQNSFAFERTDAQLRHRKQKRIVVHRPINRVSEAPSLLSYDFWVAVELARQRIWEQFLNPQLRPPGHSRIFDLVLVSMGTVLFALGSNLGGVAILLFGWLIRNSYDKRFP